MSLFRQNYFFFTANRSKSIYLHFSWGNISQNSRFSDFKQNDKCHVWIKDYFRKSLYTCFRYSYGSTLWFTDSAVHSNLYNDNHVDIIPKNLSVITDFTQNKDISSFRLFSDANKSPSRKNTFCMRFLYYHSL